MRSWCRGLLAALIVAMIAAAPAVAGPMSMLPGPGAVEGWEWRDQPRTYTPGDIYEYIDGAAELYLAYGFREAAVADYVREDGGSDWIIVEIYDMGAPLHVLGIYGVERPPEVDAFEAGVEGYVSERLIVLRQDRYYVKVLLVMGEDMDAARWLAALTARHLPPGGRMPAEFARLPAENRRAGSERYVKTDALGHKFLEEVVSAEYTIGETPAALHVADLEIRAKSAEGLWKLRHYEAKAGKGLADVEDLGEGGFAVTDSTYGELVAARQGRFLVIGMSEKAAREEVAGLVWQALEGLREADRGE